MFRNPVPKNYIKRAIPTPSSEPLSIIYDAALEVMSAARRLRNGLPLYAGTRFMNASILIANYLVMSGKKDATLSEIMLFLRDLAHADIYNELSVESLIYNINRWKDWSQGYNYFDSTSTPIRKILNRAISILIETEGSDPDICNHGKAKIRKLPGGCSCCGDAAHVGYDDDSRNWRCCYCSPNNFPIECSKCRWHRPNDYGQPIYPRDR